mmetsp:Transcript_47943/g.138759  ORF Transcript_47943/g.138759 Transcript_47943/m.138759 type:complete len:273 (+) Transcript_47943:189-1007(+)
MHKCGAPKGYRVEEPGACARTGFPTVISESITANAMWWRSTSTSHTYLCCNWDNARMQPSWPHLDCRGRKVPSTDCTGRMVDRHTTAHTPQLPSQRALQRCRTHRLAHCWSQLHPARPSVAVVFQDQQSSLELHRMEHHQAGPWASQSALGGLNLRHWACPTLNPCRHQARVGPILQIPLGGWWLKVRSKVVAQASKASPRQRAWAPETPNLLSWGLSRQPLSAAPCLPPSRHWASAPCWGHLQNLVKRLLASSSLELEGPLCYWRAWCHLS